MYCSRLGIARVRQRAAKCSLDQAGTAHAYEVIQRNARIQAQLVADLLDVSRAASGKLNLDLQPVDLRAALGAALESVADEAVRKGVHLRSPPDDRVITVRGDRVRIAQIIVNLLSNAIKFTPRGGSVQAALDTRSGAARLRVIDTGEGFTPQFAEQMFQPFSQSDSQSTRRHGGLGLGLMIVKHLVEAQGGHVSAESSGAGSGATFSVELPLHAGSVAQGHVANEEIAEERLLCGLRALIVEDHADSRDFIHRVLQRCGADVRDAGSAGEALALLAESTFDIVVSDLGMPVVDGYGFLRALRGSAGPGRDVPVLALSAYASADDSRRALAAGFFAHAAKPVDARKLVQLVAHAAGRAA